VTGVEHRRSENGNPTVLVRRVGPETAEAATKLLAGSGLSPDVLEACAAGGGLFVAEDVAAPRRVETLAAVAFGLDRGSRGARMLGLACSAEASAGLIRTLMSGAAMLMRADGIEVIEATIDPRSPKRRVLITSGFGETGGAHLLYWL
jgi:hypothetical protein